MKILVIAPTPFFADRGCHIRIYEEAKALIKKGHKIDIYTYHNGRDIKGLNIFRIIPIPWYKKISAGPSVHKIYLDILLLFRILFSCYFKNYDVIHAHLHEGCLIGWFVKVFLFFKPKLIFDAQGSLVGEMSAHGKLKGSFALNIFYFLEKIILKMPNHIVCSSDEVKKYFIEKYNVKNNKIELLEDGTDFSLIDKITANELENIYINYKIPKNKKILIYTGGLSELKGVDFLLENFQKLIQNNKDYYLIVIGYPKVAWYEKMAEELRIQDNVKFLGQIKYADMFKFLKIADAAIDPKLEGTTEASGKIINYMAASLPVICQDNEKNKNYLKNNGFYFNEQNINEKTIKAINSGKINYNREKLSWDNNITKLIKLYE